MVWLKDGQPLRTGSRVRLLTKEHIKITSVTKEDRGMYQCFVRNDYDAVQSTAEIRLGGKFCATVSVYALSSFSYNRVWPHLTSIFRHLSHKFVVVNIVADFFHTSSPVPLSGLLLLSDSHLSALQKH